MLEACTLNRVELPLTQLTVITSLFLVRTPFTVSVRKKVTLALEPGKHLSLPRTAKCRCWARNGLRLAINAIAINKHALRYLLIWASFEIVELFGNEIKFARMGCH